MGMNGDAVRWRLPVLPMIGDGCTAGNTLNWTEEAETDAETDAEADADAVLE